MTDQNKITMSKDQLHELAQAEIPEIPKTWPAIIAFLVGKWGVGAIFGAMLVPVYLDLKASNERFAKLSEANVQAIMTLSQRIERGQDNVATMQETVRRIEATLGTIQK